MVRLARGVVWDRRGPGIRLVVAAALPWLATAVAALPPLRSSRSAASAGFIYLFAVVGASLVAGLRGGLVASLLSALGLNFFFVPPRGAFVGPGREDLLTLAAFLLLSVLVATLLGEALRHQARAEQGEQEARSLYRIAASLLGGVGLPVALERFAADLTEQLGLARCEVYVGDAGNGLPPIAAAGREGPVGAESIDLPLTTERGEFGSVRIVSGSPSGFDEHRRRMARAFANQAALAVEMATLADDWRRAQAEAETSRARAALFSSVTHDLRTPLSTIRAAATSLLERGVTFDEDQRQGLLETITEESDRLNRLLTNVLSLSRFRAGTLTPQKSPTAMEDVIGVSVTSMRRRWEGTNIRVWVNEDLPLVPMDPVQIDQVLTNLLENALKFGQNGDPVELRATNEEGGVCVSISDCGPGIPPSEREKVFEEFFCHDAGAGSAGAGLGLAIARAVVVAHGGSIWIDETPTGGAIVGFRLPQAAQ